MGNLGKVQVFDFIFGSLQRIFSFFLYLKAGMPIKEIVVKKREQNFEV